MYDGAFVVRFNAHERESCHFCEFDYDEWQYAMNNRKRKPFPRGTGEIEIFIEEK